MKNPCRPGPGLAAVKTTTGGDDDVAVGPMEGPSTRDAKTKKQILLELPVPDPEMARIVVM